MTTTSQAAAGTADPAAPLDSPTAHGHHQSFWLWVLCLTGVDYFSTLGYQPSIAFENTGLLAPLATVVLVLVTLGGALPIYAYVAGKSSHGQGSIAMLEKLVRGWTGKFLVLILLGFAATDFVITKTLSAADAAEHLVHNPFWKYAPTWLHSDMVVTMLLLVMLGALFLRGFKEVIYIAVVIVGVYLALNVVVVGSALAYLASHPDRVTAWYGHVAAGEWHIEHNPFGGHEPWMILAVCLLYFPKLALGLSGFETGVAVMPLVKGSPDDDPVHPQQRIRNTRKLLLTAAVIMSFFLLGSAVATSMLIDPAAFQPGSVDDSTPRAVNRALAYLAHNDGGLAVNPLFGDVFGTIYDISTVAILWFAGASAMSALLNLVPQYLPRYGMAPEWAKAVRPLVILFTVVNLFVTWVFDASVSKQGAAYATGVMVLMLSASVAVIVDQYRSRTGSWLWRVRWDFVLIACVFLYTTGAIVIEKPVGIAIASCFIAAVVASSMVSRTLRATELRFTRFEFVDEQSRFLWETLKYLEFPILVPHRPGRRPLASKEEDIRRVHRLAPDVPIVYIEAIPGDASEFTHTPLMEVKQEEGRFIIRVTRCVSIAHVIATVAIELSKVGKPPEIHFGWSDEIPLAASVRFVLFGEGNVPWMVRELIRRAEPDPARQSRVVIG